MFPIIVVAIWALAACGNGPGALESSPWSAKITISHRTELGAAVTFGGSMMLLNPTDADATVTDVTIEEVDGNMSYLGWRVRDIGAPNAVGQFMATGVEEPFPPTDARPTGDGRVPPSRARNTDGDLVGDQELVIGLRLNGPGIATATSVRVEYRDRDGSHTIKFPLKAVLCAPRDALPVGCQAESN